jgi:hypothetical protein
MRQITKTTIPIKKTLQLILIPTMAPVDKDDYYEYD